MRKIKFNIRLLTEYLRRRIFDQNIVNTSGSPQYLNFHMIDEFIV